MRFLLLCSTDLNGCINLNTLLPALAPQHSVRVLLSNCELSSERGNRFADQKIWYEKDFLLEYLFPYLDAAPERSADLLTFSGLSVRWNVPIIPIERQRVTEHLAEQMEMFRPQLLFCCRFDYIVHPSIFSNACLLGAFNMHSGLLPQCAGPDATFWAMRHGWRRSGCTIHKLTAEIDGGDIMEASSFTLDYTRSLLWNRMRAYEGGLKAFFAIVRRLEQGLPLEGRTQQKNQRQYYPFPALDDFSAFHEAGGQLVDAAHYASLVQRFLPAGMPLPPHICRPHADAAPVEQAHNSPLC